jgi:hypothetical protein
MVGAELTPGRGTTWIGGGSAASTISLCLSVAPRAASVGAKRGDVSALSASVIRSAVPADSVASHWQLLCRRPVDWFGGQAVRPTVPKPVNLRVDPFEQHMDAPSYPIYVGEKLWTVLPAAAIIQQHVATFTDFPPRQAPPGFNPQALVEPVIQAAAQRQGN